MQDNNLSFAIKYFDFAIKAQNTTAASYNNKAICNFKNVFKNINKPIKKLSYIAKNNPANVAGLADLGMFYYMAGKYEQAASTFKKIADVNTCDCFYIRELADSYLANGEYQQAITYYKKYISSCSDESDVFISLARAYDKNQDQQNAFISYQSAIRADSDNADAYKYFGYFLLGVSRDAEAKGLLRKYTELAPNSYDLVW